jgi:hypothetical protein
MSRQIPSRKLQTSLSPADWALVVEAAEVMTITPSRLGEIAIREWLLQNRRRVLDHYG